MTLPPPVRMLLWPLSLLYGLVTHLRAWLYAQGILKQKRLNRPVISIGNLTVGGTGKTPMVIWLAERLLAEGTRVGILSRGYKGRAGTSDEIELMKFHLHERALFGVGADRYQQGRKLESSVDVFLLDDGFQHLQLARDVNMLLLDGSRKLKQQWLLPAGELREPIRELKRADIIVVTRKAEHLTVQAQDSYKYRIFYAQTQLLGFRTWGFSNNEKYLSEIGPGPFFAFCGLGNPEAFLQDLNRWHVPVCGHSFFRDHHRYTQSDCRKLTDLAMAARSVGFVTTEKDWINLREVGPLPLPTYIAVITLSLHSDGEFHSCLDRALFSGSKTP